MQSGALVVDVVEEVVADVVDEVEELVDVDEVDVEELDVDELELEELDVVVEEDVVVLDDDEVVVADGPSWGQDAGAGAWRARNLFPSSLVMRPPKKPHRRRSPIWTMTPTPPCGTPPSGCAAAPRA